MPSAVPDARARARRATFLSLAPALVGLALSPLLAAQEAESGASEASRPLQQAKSLQQVVDDYLMLTYDDEAEDALDVLLQRPDAQVEGLRAAVQHAPAFEAGVHEHRYPFQNRDYRIRVHVPEGHAKGEAPRPLLFCVGRGQTGSAIKIRGVVYAYIIHYVQGTHVRQFSDEARDLVLRAAHFVAHRYNADRIWLSGYSWGAHASFDTALHRPGFLRGIAPTGGGPRRVHFRLIPNLRGLTILSYCGVRDDPELVWTLREFDRRRKRDKLDFRLFLDPDQGHNTPLAGYARVPDWIAAEKLHARPTKGIFYADGNAVESPLLRCVVADAKKVKQPAKISVSARAKPDQVRRAWIRALDKRVATARWQIRSGKNETRIEVKPAHIDTLHIHLRASHALPASRVVLRCGKKTLLDGEFRVDARAMLEEARRTLQRRDPILRRFRVTL